MRAIPAFATCVVVMIARVAVADPQVDFKTTFAKYRDAMQALRYSEAVTHADDARRLGEELYADNAKIMATLVFNQGHALAMAGIDREAYPVLKEARKLVRAFDDDPELLVEVETYLLSTAPDHAAARHLTGMLRLATRYYPEDSEMMAELKLTGGKRVWWDRRAQGLLGDAAETFARLGKTERQAQAQFWLGRIQIGRDQYRDAVESMTQVVEMLPPGNGIVLIARANLVEAYESSARATGPPSIVWRLEGPDLGRARPTTSRCSHGHRPIPGAPL